jgi:hypothetical protein
MRRVMLLVFLFIGFSGFGQKLIRGQVLNSSGRTPIPYASIFLSNTSIGAKANEDGSFELSVPAGKFDLIVSCIGFDTYNATIIASEQPDFIKITLNPKSEEMDTLVVEPYEKDGWRKWGDFFIQNFIGTSEFAKSCEIKNYEVIRFRDVKSKHTLFAYALEPLIIENKALGYRLTYQLETFSFDFNTRFISYAGYPFFEELKDNFTRQKRVEKNRKQAYYGSMMHFMRAVFFNKITEEEFDVRTFKRKWNMERLRVAKLLNGINGNPSPSASSTSSGKDSMAYYNGVMKQEMFATLLVQMP